MNSFDRLLVLLLLALLVADGIAEQSLPQRHTTDGKLKQDLNFTHDSHELVFSTLKTNS